MSDSGQAEFLAKTNVSRETMKRLEVYASLLRRWNEKINLVSGSTIASMWSRHFLDSAQLLQIMPNASGLWLDLGSGGGFPGLVVAAIAEETHKALKVELVESDIRKATFLGNAAREMGLDITVHASRIEKLPAKSANILSARALASLDQLLEFAYLHLSPSGTAVFPKGEKHKSEIATAQKSWHFDLEQIPSLTDSSASILKITELSRV